MAYRKLDPEDVVLSTQLVSTPIWTGNVTKISKESSDPSLDDGLHFKSQQQGSLSGLYYLDIYKFVDPMKTGPLDAEEVQFSIAYGDRDGSGSAYYNSDPITKPNTYSKTIYGQYRSLVLGDEDSEFYLANSSTPSNNFIALTIDRARFKEKLVLGTLRLEVGDLVLTDNSEFSGTVQYVDSGRLYKIVKEGEGAEENTNTYGFFLPDIGVILLDCKMIGMPDDIRWDPWEKDSDEDRKSAMEIFFDMFKSIELQSEETVTSNYVFVRARNAEFNYSTNPSNITGSGELRHDIMINQPQAYITSVGLYNDNNDLLAVAKLSRPLLKDFTKEAIIRVKIDY